VSLYTGTPNISVPIYTHKGRELDLPISLTYDASGVKVDQQATNIGLSWNLNVGGRISRIVNGLPDDYEIATNQYQTMWNSYVRDNILLILNNESQTSPKFNNEGDALAYLEFLRAINDNECDALPDFFSFNALGINDMFVIDVNSQEAKALNNPRIKIELIKTGANQHSPGHVKKWNVTLEDGTRLIFGQYNNSTLYPVDAVEVTESEHFDDASPEALNARHRKYNSSWLLNEIISPRNKDNYKFIYRNFGLKIVPEGNTAKTVVNYTSHQGLIEILYNGETIVDLTLKPRQDAVIKSAVDKIEIKRNNNLIKGFVFNHTYFNDDSSSNPFVQKRLKLDAIDLTDQNNQVVSNYQFYYDSPNQLPPRFSTSQDYYGYYNGKSNGDELYPKSTFSVIEDGADRSVSFSHAKKGNIERIVYPTGGYTDFQFEAHRSSYITPQETQEHTAYYPKSVLNLQGGYECTVDSCSNECGHLCCQYYFTGAELGGYTGSPKVTHDVFYIEEAGDYLLNSVFDNSANQGTTESSAPGVKIAVFKRDDVNSENPNLNPAPIPLDEIYFFPDAYMNQGNVAFDNNASTGSNHTERPITLERGYYQATLANPRENSTLHLNLGRYETDYEQTGGETVMIEKAGMRIRSISDYTSDNILALRKKYTYGDGNVISQPFYEYLVSEYSVNEFMAEDTPPPPMLYRTTHASGTDKPHIGYEEVNEIIENFHDASGITDIATRHTFNTAHWGNHHTGTYTYFPGGKETTKRYSVNYALGKSKEVISNGRVEGVNSPIVSSNAKKYYDTYTYDQKNYYVNKGIGLRVNELRNHLYACPQENPNTNKWYIAYLPPTLLPSFSGNGTLLGEAMTTGGAGVQAAGAYDGTDEGNPGTVYYDRPVECDNIEDRLCSTALGRIDLEIAKAFGNAGYIQETIRHEKIKTGIIDGEDPEETQFNWSISQKTINEYYDNEEETPYNFLLKSTTTNSSQGRVVAQEFLYPDNFASEYSGLKSHDIIATPVQINTYEGLENDLKLVHRQKTEYGNTTLPQRVKTAKGNDDLEERISFDRYDDGNLIQSSQEGGVPTAYIWGYDKQYVIAKIENVTYAEIEALPSFGQGFEISQGLSVNQETQLRSSLTNAMITTYSYEPSIGITSMTDPRGNSIFYEYDDNNRLEFVKDKDHNILSKNEYNYRTQN